MVLHPSGPIAQRRFFHRRLPTTGAYRCLHQRLERKRRALRLDQEKGPPTPLQRQAYHSTLILGTSALMSFTSRTGKPQQFGSLTTAALGLQRAFVSFWATG